MSGVATVARTATTSRPTSGPWLEVDLSAIATNTALISARAAGEVMAVVKADGLGHGALDVATTALAHGATWLGVTSLSEAWPLRDAGIGAPLLSWLNPVDADFATAVGRRVDVAVPSRAHLAAVARVAGVAGLGGPARVHLHLDAGMARDGAPPQEWTWLCRAARAAEQRGAVEVVGVMAHLGCADDPGDPCNALARRRFAWAVEVARRCGLRPRHRHLAATAATLTDPGSHHTMSRIGAGLVGIDPSRTTRLRPALTLTAPLVSVRRVPVGTAVGYGHRHRTTGTTYLGLVPVGYADGLPRAASGRAEVLVRERRAPVAGLLSMDQLVVDLGRSGAEVGDEVTLFGPGDAGEPTVADWAAWSDTIEHEIVTRLGRRIPRRVRGTVPARARLRGVR